MSRWFLAIVIGVLGFVVGRASLTLLVGDNVAPIPVVDPIRDAYSQSVDDFNTLLMGSSRVYRGLDPQAFDAAMNSAGVRSKSFNHSWPDMSLVEMLRVLESIPEGTPVERILIEPSMFSLWVVENPSSVRSIAFHSPRTTLDMLTLIGCGNHSTQDVLDAGYHTLMAGLSHSVGLGGLREAMKASVALPPASSNGFRPLDEETDPAFIARQQKLKKRASAYRKRVRKIHKKQRRPRDLAECERELIERVIAVGESLGARVTLIIPPTVRRVREYAGLRTGVSGLDNAVLAYDDPDAFPTLYAIENRFDIEHLNSVGARLWAEYLARDVLALEQED